MKQKLPVTRLQPDAAAKTVQHALYLTDPPQMVLRRGPPNDADVPGDQHLGLEFICGSQRDAKKPPELTGRVPAGALGDVRRYRDRGLRQVVAEHESFARREPPHLEDEVHADSLCTLPHIKAFEVVHSDDVPQPGRVLKTPVRLRDRPVEVRPGT